MKFKEKMTYLPGAKSLGIDYKAIDPDYDPVENPVFNNTSLIDEDGVQYVIGDYSGELDLTPYDPDSGVVQVIVLDITGDAVLTKEDDNSGAVIRQLTDLVVTIAIPLPDNTPVLIPLKREDTGRVVKVFGAVSDGQVVLNLQLPTAGDWYCDTDLINKKTAKGITFAFSGLKLETVL